MKVKNTGFLSWINFLSSTKNTSLTKKDNKAYKELILTYSEIIANLFDDIMTYVSLQSLADKLKVGFVAGSIKLGDLRNSLLNLLSNYYYESNILEDARSLMIHDCVDDMLRLYAELGRGTRGERFDVDADICDKVVVFKCTHVLPKKLRGWDNMRTM